MLWSTRLLAHSWPLTASSSSIGLSTKQQEDLDEEEGGEAEQIELLKSIRPWQSMTVSAATPFPNPQDATLTAYGYLLSSAHFVGAFCDSHSREDDCNGNQYAQHGGRVRGNRQVVFWSVQFNHEEIVHTKKI